MKVVAIEAAHRLCYMSAKQSDNDMSNFFKLLLLVGALWAVDAVAFDGRYSNAISQQAKYQGQMVRYEIRDWFTRMGI